MVYFKASASAEAVRSASGGAGVGAATSFKTGCGASGVLASIRLIAKGQGYLMSLVSGGQWSQQRKFQCGYVQDPSCLVCGKVGS